MNAADSATMPRDSDSHSGQVLVQERLMRAEAEHRLANLLQFVFSNLEQAAGVLANLWPGPR